MTAHETPLRPGDQAKTYERPRGDTTMIRATAIVAYIGSIAAANWLTSRYGMIPVWPGLAATAGTYAAGAALLLRDMVQDTGGRRAVVAAIASGAALSAWLSTPALAIASGTAFLISETADMAVYTPLRRRGWGRAALASGVIGSIADTVVFLWLAGFPILAGLAGQLVGKALWATAIPVVAVVTAQMVRRALLRDPIGT